MEPPKVLLSSGVMDRLEKASKASTRPPPRPRAIRYVPTTKEGMFASLAISVGTIPKTLQSLMAPPDRLLEFTDDRPFSVPLFATNEKSWASSVFPYLALEESGPAMRPDPDSLPEFAFGVFQKGSRRYAVLVDSAKKVMVCSEIASQYTGTVNWGGFEINLQMALDSVKEEAGAGERFRFIYMSDGASGSI